MRQRGALPFWLIAGAIRQRRSGFSDELLHYIQNGSIWLELTTSL
ncbi:hypothetical protein ORD22_14955 [Sporosarcina sp. GW1-11]|nr:hypothetical protein [Sporosarcina sp. GW1-11]MDV6379513.1 hypothetical protein [Sporosarcina sp. GW1-11]